MTREPHPKFPYGSKRAERAEWLAKATRLRHRDDFTGAYIAHAQADLLTVACIAEEQAERDRAAARRKAVAS